MEKEVTIKRVMTTVFTFSEEEVEKLLRKEANIPDKVEVEVEWLTYKGGINEVTLTIGG